MIDRQFIAALEGGLQLTGTVPRDAKGQVVGHSGVTIADGVDLGQRNARDLAGLHLDPDLARLLEPYLSVTGPLAVALLKRAPLRLTAGQAKILSDAVHAADERRLSDSYDGAVAVGRPRFALLPDAPATVMASLAHQYGDVAKACPRFWRAAVSQDWGALIVELENFGDDFPTRRYKEADYLRGMMLA